MATKIQCYFDNNTNQIDFKTRKAIQGLRFQFNMALLENWQPVVFSAGVAFVDTKHIDVEINHGSTVLFNGNLQQLATMYNRNNLSYQNSRYMDVPTYTAAARTSAKIDFDVVFPMALNVFASEQLPLVVKVTCRNYALPGPSASLSTVTLGAATVTYVSGQTGAPIVQAGASSFLEVECLFADDAVPMSGFSPKLVCEYIPAGTGSKTWSLPPNVNEIRLLDTSKPRIGFVNPNVALLPSVNVIKNVKIQSPTYSIDMDAAKVVGYSRRTCESTEEMLSIHDDHILYTASGGTHLDNATLDITLEPSLVRDKQICIMYWMAVESFPGQVQSSMSMQRESAIKLAQRALKN